MGRDEQIRRRRGEKRSRSGGRGKENYDDDHESHASPDDEEGDGCSSFRSLIFD